MSLILEALKKLEREKGAPDRGFLVMAHVPWASGRRGGTRLAVGTVVLLLATGAGAWLVGRGRPGATPAAPTTPATASAPAAASPAAAPGTSAASAGLLPAPVNTASPPSVPASTGAAEAKPHENPFAPEFRLNAISRQDGHPVALLNDRLVREGDAFDGVRILRIGETEVEIEVGGKRRVIGF